jgi:putative ABC transport system permease protein
MLQDLVRDFRHAFRLFVAAPTFSLVATLTLGLGIGANTAIFSVINGLLLQPLPYSEPDRLLFVDGVLTRAEGEVSFQLSYQDVEDIRARATTIASVAPWTDAWGLALEGTDGAQRLEANFVGRDYFAVLGGVPLQGHVFGPEDHAIGEDGSLIAILSESAWRQYFGADPAIVGRDVRLQNRVFTIVGVMPSTFHDAAASQGSRVDVWAPIERAPALFGLLDLRSRGSRLMWGVARLSDGATVESAAAELRTLGAQIASANPASNTNFSYRAASLANSFFVDARRPLWLLLGGSLFVLLIGCANVANLLLVRSAERARELAVRLAVGASNGRIIRQLLVESAVLALAGGIAGVMLAVWLTPLLVRLSGITLPAFSSPSIDGPVLAVAMTTAIACGLLFGLAPVWRATRISVRDTIAGGGSGRVAPSSRTAKWLAGIEVTAAFVLAAGALLMLQSFSALTQTDLQFRSDRLLTVRLELPQDRYNTPATRALAGQEMLERLRALPGVEHAMIWGPSMFAHSTWVAFLTPTDRLAADDGERLMVWRHSTNPGALGDLGIQLRAGRDLAASDTLDTPQVGVISEAAAARLWPGQNAVGRQVRSGSGGTATTITIVGVAADARHRGRFRFSQGAAAYEPQLDLYLPYAQRPNNLVTLGVRTHGDAGGHTSAVRAAIASFDPAVPIYDVDALENRMRAEASPVGFAALLLNLYGGLAILLAGLGVYGVLASGVAMRMRELGIRSALGANPSRLLAGVVAEGVSVSLVAISVGAALSWALARAFGGMLFGVSSGNGASLTTAAAILVTLAAAASLIPARRAARVDPVRVLRND